MSGNAVESLLSRLNLQDFIGTFRDAGVEKIITLRNLSEDKLKDLIPDAEQRQKLTDALTRNSEAGAKVAPPGLAPAPVMSYSDQTGNTEARAGGQKICRYFRTANGCKKGDACNLAHIAGPPIPNDTPAAVPRARRACRDFFNDTCKYGNDCRFSHSDDSREPDTEGKVNPDTYSEDVQVPFESVRYLLGNKAEKLQRINAMCGTTNSRIEKPESYMSTFVIKVKGSKEGVSMARAEIERFVGITSSQNKEARFQYVSHELERNIQSCKMLAAFNMASQGTELEMSEASLKAVVNTFRFQVPQRLDHFWTLTAFSDKEKFEICTRCAKHLNGVQGILFTELKRVVEMEKRASQTAQAFGVNTVYFMHRDQTKEQRMKALEGFKEGEVKPDGTRQRLLVTTSDYAKLARKIEIPYVNFIVHFAIPKTKELYTFQAMCAGRHGHKGLNLLFILNNDATTQREWSQSLPLNEMTDNDWEKATKDLVYDTEENPLNPKEADPPANWREILEQEKAAKAAAKAAKK